jgi:predicted esterase
MRFAHSLARVPRLQNFAFTPDGRHVTRLTDRDDGAFMVEACYFADESDTHDGVQAYAPGERVYGSDPSLSIDTQLSFLSPDRIRITCCQEGCLRIIEARRNGTENTDGTWTAEPIAECEAAMLLPRLEGADWDLVISCTDGVSTIWRIEDNQPRLRPLARVPGILTGGAWLEPARRLAASITEPGGATSGYVVDLVTQTYHRWLHISDDSNDYIALCDPYRGLLGITSDCWGYRRAGVANLRNGHKVRFFAELPGEDRSANLCGFSGPRMILRRQHGVVTELWFADPADLSISGPLGLPDGFMSLPVVQAGNRIRFVFSTPTVPTACASYLPAKEPSKGTFRFEEAPDLGELTSSDLITPRVVWIRGPRGAIETLVYEPPESRRRDLLVVALHGGPVQQWFATFTPELQLFAGLGAVVVAPNYHGSSGYGNEFVSLLEGAAGSVDVDDIIAVIIAMRAASGLERAAIVLYGHSYGAFLALLVAATYPQLCDGVVAVAPFTSLSSMRAVGTPWVQRLIDLLWTPTRDEQTDLLNRCGDLRAKLLIAHGSRDEVIPIQQSKALCDRLRAHGYRDGQNLWFLSFPEEGHRVEGRVAVLRLYDQIESFLCEVTSAPRVSATAASDRHQTRSRVGQAGGRPLAR